MRAHLVLVVAVALAGCKKEAPQTEAAPVKAAAPAAPAAPPPAPKVSPGPPLSVFEANGDACEWKKLEPVSGAAESLASMPGTCIGVRVAWSADLVKAVVLFDPQHVQNPGYFSQTSSKPGYPQEVVDEKSAPRAYAVDLGAKKAVPLPLPALKGLTLESLAVDTDGAPLAFLEESLADEVVKRGSVTSNGKTFDLTQFSDGLPELAHAYRYDGAAWRHTETAATTTGWDLALGVQALDAYQHQGPTSDDLSAPHAQGDAVEGAALEPLKKLAPPKATSDDGDWIFLGVGSERLYVWEITAEFAFTTGLLAAGSPPKVLPKLGFTDGDIVTVRTSGAHALVTASSVGTHPRLYAFPGAQLVYSSDTARGVTFWPTAPPPTSHEEETGGSSSGPGL